MFKRLPLLIIVVALAIWLSSFIIKNFLGVSLIAYGNTDASRDAAVNFAPGNPEVLAARGRYLLYRADPPRLTEAIADLERAVELSPRDYRFRLELAKAYESNGDAVRAEAAVRSAVDLAPNYFETRWALGNLHLRQGKMEAALDDFRQSIEVSSGFSPRPDYDATFNVFNAISGALGMNLEALRRATPPDNVSQASLARFLASNNALDEAVRLWRELPPDEPNSYRSLNFQLLHELQIKGRFAEAKEVWEKLIRLEGNVPNDPLNLITNPGFERPPLSETYPLLVEPPTGFDWVIRRHTEVRAQRENDERHSGNFALHISFPALMRSEFQDVLQIIPVEAMKTYRLSYFVKTKYISAETPPLIEISDAMRPGNFALRLPAPGGTNDWREQTMTFTTPADTYGLRLTFRSPQLPTIDRTRIGEVWFDDFNLRKER